MNVLGLCDGMSCGQIALNRAGIKYDNYFASEVDKYAIKVTQANYPNTVQLGDINNWESWGLPKIDLLIGGTPCQGFSVAGKQLNFDDPRSKLFFKFVDCLEWYKPKYFLLENVKMKKECQDIISKYLRVEPIEINSALVSAQNRRRLYWTNILKLEQPEDKHICLKDILESSETIFPASITGRRINKEGKRDDYNKNIPFAQCLQVKHDNKTNCLTTVQKDNVLSKMSPGRYVDVYNNSKIHYRSLTPMECERLQTVPDNYTNHVSKTQRYKMLGSGWTVDVIAYILKEVHN